MGEGEKNMFRWGLVGASGGITLAAIGIVLAGFTIGIVRGSPPVSIRDNSVVIAGVMIALSIGVIVLSSFAIKKILFANKIYKQIQENAADNTPSNQPLGNTQYPDNNQYSNYNQMQPPPTTAQNISTRNTQYPPNTSSVSQPTNPLASQQPMQQPTQQPIQPLPLSAMAPRVLQSQTYQQISQNSTQSPNPNLKDGMFDSAM